MEGIARCKTERDVWAAVEVCPKSLLVGPNNNLSKVISSLHQRFSTTFTPAFISAISLAIGPPNRVSLSALTPEQREKDENVRLTRQRPVLRACSELALVGVIKDGPGRSGGEWVMKAVKELASILLS